jgi:hypothetical protein
MGDFDIRVFASTMDSYAPLNKDIIDTIAFSGKDNRIRILNLFAIFDCFG